VNAESIVAPSVKEIVNLYARVTLVAFMKQYAKKREKGGFFIAHVFKRDLYVKLLMFSTLNDTI
jgi:hypothetical protein